MAVWHCLAVSDRSGEKSGLIRVRTAIDPFVGGGGVFLSLDFNKALLSDINQELMDLYRAIKQDPVGVWSIFESYPSTKHDYYRIRNDKKVGQLEQIME
jgi:DNA adenine methylase